MIFRSIPFPGPVVVETAVAGVTVTIWFRRQHYMGRLPGAYVPGDAPWLVVARGLRAWAIGRPRRPFVERAGFIRNAAPVTVAASRQFP